ncbi:unnamed protein product [Phyllotreta striolata]|uniref:Nucleoporin NSP1-like C-terminal domain-containing protein n=1 Tax=Phyllotreta striolata TaxID=444603 RepID=A0A9N9XQL0_PHYSR|nr:unnamed protein product [Phyllotreta striolata]
MSFNFGNTSTPKTAATGFTLPSNPATTSATGLQFNFGGGDTKTEVKPSSTLFSTATSGAPAFGIAPQPATSASAAPSFNFGTPTTQQPTASAFGTAALASLSTPTSSSQFGLTSRTPKDTSGLYGSTTAAAPTPASTGLGFGPAVSTTSSAAPATTGTTPLFGVASTPSTTTLASAPALGLSTTVSSAASTTPSTSLSTTTAPPAYSTSTLTSTGSLTFSQLEDSINKWTIDLEEQGKFFINQAKQLNAWDSLLISNGEKILNLNGSIERVKQQQQQLDQELDFVLAQQKELEELITPLEKELLEIPVTDIDRNQMYQFSEIIDSQLKQMSDDLKEIIEHINESNKSEEVSNPLTQISRIMNAHMNSLQWLDRNTAQIVSHLEQINKMQDSNRRNFPLNHSFNNSLL